MARFLFSEDVVTGYNCMGCAMSDEVFFGMELSQQEIAQIGKIIEREQNDDIVIIKEDMPELYQRIRSQFDEEIFCLLVDKSWYNGDINLGFFDEEVLMKHFKEDCEKNAFDPKEWEMGERDGYDSEEEWCYDAWVEWESHNIEESPTDYLSARYNIKDHLDIDYNGLRCHFPEELIPEGVTIIRKDEESSSDELISGDENFDDLFDDEN